MHQPRKRFGQHFLADALIIERMIDMIDPTKDKHFVEIGPGQGVLTAQLLARGARVTAIEIDRDLVALLDKNYGSDPKFSVVCADALKTDLASLLGEQKAYVVGNLPYNISTPLLNHLFSQIGHVIEMNFMLQKEVVARMCATHGGSDFGRLSIHTQIHCQATKTLHVPPEAFSPPPKVDSAVVRLTPHLHQLTSKHRSVLGQLTQRAFSQRRKMIKTSLRDTCSEEELKSHDIEPNSRPDTVAISTYVALAKYILERNDDQ